MVNRVKGRASQQWGSLAVGSPTPNAGTSKTPESGARTTPCSWVHGTAIGLFMPLSVKTFGKGGD